MPRPSFFATFQALALLGAALPAALTAAGAPQVEPEPRVQIVSSAPAVLLGNFDPTQLPLCAAAADPALCQETLVGIYYPAGLGPKGLGYAHPPAPVFINLRGGNSNPALPGLYLWFAENVLPKGFVGIDPNYAIVGPGEGFVVAEESIARLIQYLRHHAAWLNIDPERIFLFGRSFGGFMTYAVGLRQDWRDLASPEPIHWHSSRPDFLLPYSAPTDLSCLDPNYFYGWLLDTYFPVSLAPGATYEQKQADSPIHWLLNPQLFGRTETPPMYMGYHLGHLAPCGSILDPHNGLFGLLMRDAIDAFVVQENLPALGLASELQDTQDLWGYTALMAPAVDWAADKLQPQPPMMYQPKPLEPLTPQGSVQTLRALGAVPGASVHFWVATQFGPVSLPWCPNISVGLGYGAFFLGAAPVDGLGRAELSLFVPPAAIGLPLVFHAADWQHCLATQILPHAWWQ